MARMALGAKEALERKKFLLDLIEDPSLSVCLYDVGSKSDRARIIDGIEAIINKHINNLKNDLIKFSSDDPVNRKDWANCPPEIIPTPHKK